MDILAANQLGYALYSEMYAVPVRPANTARFVFLDPRSTNFYLDWEQVASDAVAILRSQAGRDPYDRALSDLVGELSTQSETFRKLWAAHNVRFHDRGDKGFHNPVVGDLILSFETMQLSSDADLTMFAYTTERGSKSEEALNLLGSWAATPEEADTTIHVSSRPGAGAQRVDAVASALVRQRSEPELLARRDGPGVGAVDDAIQELRNVERLRSRMTARRS
jgi:hypothetical protein